MSTYVSLMYHAIYKSGEEHDAIPADERPYAVDLDSFRAQIGLISELGLKLLSSQDEADETPAIELQITFDDGAAGWFYHALPVLAEYGFSATFFTTPDLIDTRKNFCSWEQIKALADAGMSIQSHGKSHAFLSDLPLEKLAIELQESKVRLEEVTGQAVDSISFPGGRFNAATIVEGRKHGYSRFYTSEIGINQVASNEVNRIAVRADTSLDNFRKIVTQDKKFLARARTVAGFKRVAKQLLGNYGYHKLYSAVKR